MGKTFWKGLFPAKPRHLTGSRAWSITFRTLHLAAFGMLLGGHAFAVEADRLLPYLYLTILSGLGLIALEMYALGLYWLFLGKGLMVVAKLGILLAVPFFWEQRLALLMVVVVVASVGSHVPARLRHYSVLHRRVIGPEESLRPASSPDGQRLPRVWLSRIEGRTGREEGTRSDPSGGPSDGHRFGLPRGGGGAPLAGGGRRDRGCRPEPESRSER